VIVAHVRHYLITGDPYAQAVVNRAIEQRRFMAALLDAQAETGS
jgi:hypothetical protein